MSYQSDVTQMQGAGFSGPEIQNWSDNQAVQLRQAGFSQQEVDQHQGMVASAPGTPPVYGRIPTDDDFKNAASVILKGNDHPWYEKAVDALKNLHADTGVEPAEAVKASQTIPSFREIMENGGDSTKGSYLQVAARSAGSAIAQQMQGLSEMTNPDPATNSFMTKPLFTLGPNVDKPEDYWLHQKGVALQKWIDQKFPEQPQFEKDNPISTGVVGGAAQIPELIGTLGTGMAASGAHSAYEEAKQAGVPVEKAVEFAGKSGVLWGALGVTDVGAFIKPIQRAAPGLVPWVTTKAIQALRSGVTFAGTNELGDYLTTQIAHSADIPAQYKPTLQRVVVNALTGAAVGPMTPTGLRRGPEETAVADTGRGEIKTDLTAQPPADGFTRFYHGGTEYEGGKRWLTPDIEYAKGYADKNVNDGAHVSYVDVPSDHPLLKKEFDDEGTHQKSPFMSFEAPEEISKNLKRFVFPKEESKQVNGLTPAYHFDTDSYGLKNEKGEFTQTGFGSEAEAQNVSRQEIAPRTLTARIEPEEMDKYKKQVSEQAENLGFNLTPQQIDAAAQKLAESKNQVEPAKGPGPIEEKEPTENKTPYTTIPKKPLGLADFVRRNGGVNDDGGDIRATLGGAKYRPGLVNGEGMGIDDMARAAHEAGYFPENGENRPTVNDFLDKLSNDLHGRPQHSEHDAEAASAYDNALRHNHEVDRLSNETGIRAEGKTHTQFWDELTRHYSKEEANAKKSDFAQQANDAYESWRKEALEPEELEDQRYDRTQDNIAKDQKSISQSTISSGLAAGDKGKGQEVGGPGGRGTEPARGAGQGEESTASPTATGTGASENGGNGRGPSLPKQLAGAKPRYGYGDKQFTLSFENDMDKALYITSQKTPSKRDADYREFLKENGLTNAQIQSEGQKVRAEIKRSVQDHPEFEDTKKVSNLHIPDQSHSEEFLYHKIPSSEFSDKEIEEVPQLRDLRDFVKQIAPDSRFSIRDKGIRSGNSEAVGYYHPMKDIITVALTAPDKFNTAAHEALHAIVHLLTDDEYRTLVTDGLDRGLMKKYDIEKNYSDRPDVHQEEMIAHWFGDWAKDKRTGVSPEAKSLFEKVKDILSKIGEKVRQLFGTDNAEDVFGKIISGEVGKRTGERLSEDREFYHKKDYRQEKLWPEPKNDVSKDEKEEKPTIGDAIRGIRDTFSPTSAGEKAKQTETAIRGAYGESKREQSVAETALNEFARQAARMTPEEHSDFYNYVEGRSTGAQLKNKQFQAMADAVRGVYQRFRDVLQAMPETRMMNFVTDYFTHQWADGQEQKVKDFMNTWWQQGSGRNLKERKIPTIADGLEFGLKLQEPNPVRAVSRYAGSMSNYIASVKVLRAINNDLGGGYFADGRAPEGYAPLVGRNAERIENARIDPASGKLIPARNLKLYAPKQVADLYNAFYSKGFEDSRLKPAYMLARNAINTNTMLELGLSAYHFSTITMQSINQDMGRFLRNALAGDWQGVGDAVKGLMTPAYHFREGSKLEDQYKDLADHGIDMENMADQFAKSNLRLGIDPLSNISTHGGFYKAWQRGELPGLIDKLKSQMTEGYGVGALKSGAEAVGRVVSDVAHPLFNVYIPAIKMSAFHDLMGDWLRQNPGASDIEIAKNRVRIGDLVEDRFGELNMENLFWNKKAKEALGLALRAPGWDLGLVRQVGGAGYDVYRMIKDGISKNGFDPGRLDRPLFMVGAAVTYAAINSAMTYIKTGTAPSDQKIKDLIAYATGGMHKAFGWHPERAELPGHGRELLQMAPVPGEGPLSGVTQEAANKVATLPKKAWEAATNTDWNGKPIYDPNSKNWVKRVPGVAQAVHIASGFEPFSMEQLFEGGAPGSKLSLAERFLGVRAAGAKIVNPEGLAKFNKEKKH